MPSAASAGRISGKHDALQKIVHSLAPSTARGLDQFERQLLDEVAQKERAKAGLKRERESRISAPTVLKQAEFQAMIAHRNHQDLNRHEVAARRTSANSGELPRKAIDGQREAGHRRQRDRADVLQAP